MTSPPEPVQHSARRRRPLPVPRAASLLLFAITVKSVTAQDLHGAEQSLLQGRADAAIAALRSAPDSSAEHLLLCRAYLSKLHGSEASAECRTALKTGLANDSTAQDWAGRAFGMEADHAGPITGLKLAGQVRSAFKTAFELNPRNPAAANDLGEYYVSAPAIVGGGIDKASALADQIQSSMPEIAHRLRALIAEKHGDKTQAEREFLAATQVAQSPGAYVDLALFYMRGEALDKAAATARRAIALDRMLDANVVDAASTLNDAHQPGQAIPVLRSYLDHGHMSDAAPAFRVHTLLGEIFARAGDKANARKEFGAALALASDYAPARKGLDSL